MIKAVLMDVDGVIVGNKKGINFPLPNTRVLTLLKSLNKNGVPIILCTAKFHIAVENIILKAHLDNPHITNGGALILNPIQHKILHTFTINKTLAQRVATVCQEKNIYTEVYTPQSYYILKSQKSPFTHIREQIMQYKPTMTESWHQVIKDNDIIKIIVFSKNEDEKQTIDRELHQFDTKLTHVWSSHPFTGEMGGRIMTARTVSKDHAAQLIMNALDISFTNVLGIGDTTGDWNFMKRCGYVATLENGENQLKELVKTKKHGNYFISSSLDTFGIFEIFSYFSLLQ